MLSDSVMVARGDLGVELPLRWSRAARNRLSRRRGAKGARVVATQMLESMITTSVPTRAEVSDVCERRVRRRGRGHALGRDRLGRFSCRSGGGDGRIAQAWKRSALPPASSLRNVRRPNTPCLTPFSPPARCHIDDSGGSHRVLDESGSTGLRAARERPQVPILALTPSRRWHASDARLGPALRRDCGRARPRRCRERACQIAFSQGFAKPGERVVITAVCRWEPRAPRTCCGSRSSAASRANYAPT